MKPKYTMYLERTTQNNSKELCSNLSLHCLPVFFLYILFLIGQTCVDLILPHSERPNLYTILAFLTAILTLLHSERPKDDNFNPTALRKAKIVHNFGLSECNGLKIKQSTEGK